jgi:hypothetical protein
MNPPRVGGNHLRRSAVNSFEIALFGELLGDKRIGSQEQ